MTGTGPVVPVDDELGPPRSNGELVFEAPWEGRAFGLAVALAEGGRFEWADFRTLLVEETAADDARQAAGGAARPYYVRWAAALERLLAERGWVEADDLAVAACREEQKGEHKAHVHHGLAVGGDRGATRRQPLFSAMGAAGEGENLQVTD